MFHQRFAHPTHCHTKIITSIGAMNVEKEKSTFFIKDQSPDDEHTQETSATFTQFNNPPVGNFSGNIKKLFNTILQFHKSMKYVLTDVLHQLTLIFAL